MRELVLGERERKRKGENVRVVEKERNRKGENESVRKKERKRKKN